MKAAGVDLMISCMDVNGNVQIARAMHQNGMTNVSQFWLDGYNSSTLTQYSSIMNNTYFMVQHVPFQAAREYPGVFPGLETYLTAMRRYAPQDVDSEVAMEGWISAALFVAGLRDAGPNPTQSKVVAAINKLSAFTAGGVTTPVDWRLAHTTVTEPSCESYVVTSTAKNGSPQFQMAFNKGHNPWVCLRYEGPLNLDHPVPPPAGSPGA
jgi:ABC-type branched-subunit amino acid transport system substrate-binding protein